MLFDVSTGSIELYASGDNAFIKRKNGKKVQIPSSEISMKLYSKATKTKDPADFQKCKEFQDKFPKIEKDDIFITGKDTILGINCNYNKGKDRPLEGYKNNETKNITIGPDSEMKIIGLETWSREDKKESKRYIGTAIKTFEILKECFFYCSFTRTEDELITPIATIKFCGLGGTATSDFYKGVLYSVVVSSSGLGNEHGTFIFTNRKTKKSYEDKSDTIREIIVSDTGIYKKSMISMDPIDYMIGTKLMAFRNIEEMPMIKPVEQVSHMQNMGNTIDQLQVSMEMFKQMSPSDIKELAKSSGATPEQMKEMQELPEMLKKMETQMPMGEFKKAMASQKAYYEGIGKEGIESMGRLQEKGQKLAVENSKKTKAEVLKTLSSPRNYGPLTANFKVA
jgi:hypothetical protein